MKQHPVNTGELTLRNLRLCAVEGNKKRYSLTETGRGHYEQNRDAAAHILSDMERIGAEMEQARQAVESGLVPGEREHTHVSDRPVNEAACPPRTLLR